MPPLQVPGTTPRITTMKRSVFYISEGTGITAESLGRCLLTQFEGITFQQNILPFVDTPKKAADAVQRIDHAAEKDGCRPLVFSTLIKPDLREIITRTKGVIYDFFETFTSPLEAELGVAASRQPGRSHSLRNYNAYVARIGALHYALSNDDGMPASNYAMADVIIVGVSRSGKTPTCLYLALQHGIHAANYPLTEEDLATARLPAQLRTYRDKLIGLTIQPERLQQIRNERRPDSRYADVKQCASEIAAAQEIFRREKIRFLDSTYASVEELATSILHELGLKRRV